MDCSWAQIIPDQTLGNESSQLVPTTLNNLTVDKIQGGAIRGVNLFHSFQEFNVNAQQRVYFSNPAEIENIFSRVTGSNPSQILGRLGVLGDANLFFLNPNGIFFGSQAQLDVRGSFLASTASSLKFADGSVFDTSDSQNTAPLLTISVPVGLQLGETPGKINVQGASLQVPSGKTLGLLGGDVNLVGGTLTAPGGNIELGSVAAGTGLVKLSSAERGWTLEYGGVDNFQDIQLSQQAVVNANGAGGGNIQVQGRQVKLTDGSQIFAVTLGSEAGGSLAVRASEFIELIGTSSNGDRSGLFSQVNSNATGNGGSLTVETRQLSVRDGAQISTSTFGVGKAGDLSIRAAEAVEVIGRSADRRIGSGLRATVQTAAPGNGGNLTIETGRLLIQDGAQISTSTFGKGNAGNININASQVDVVGVGASELGQVRPTALIARVEAGSSGRGGNLSIYTQQLSVTEGALVSVSTFGDGQAGDLTVDAKKVALDGVALSPEGKVLLNELNTPIPSGLFAGTNRASTGNGGNLRIQTQQLTIQNGALAQVSTLGDGDAGDLTVKALESVELIGTTPDGRFPSGLLAVAGFEGITTDVTGSGGNLRIETGQFIVREGAVATVSAAGSGDAGNLEIKADSIQLNNQGTLTAETASGKGGDVTLGVQGLLLMRGGSQISTTAGTAGGPGAGGNINIKSDFLIGLENSDITANSFGGAGGVVDITTQGVFGLTARQALTQEGDITAFSQTAPGLNGQIAINTSDVDPSQGLVPLSNNLFSSEQVVAGSCLARRNVEQSRFTVTGTGGLPITPYAEIDGWYAMPGAVVPPAIEGESQTINIHARPITNNQVKNWKPGDPIVEAQGIIVLADGRTVLSSMSQRVSGTENLICRTD